MIRIDKVIFPEWTLKWMYFDFNNYSYICTLVAFNHHNHPILITFLNSLDDLCKINHSTNVVTKENEAYDAKQMELEDIKKTKEGILLIN